MPRIRDARMSNAVRMRITTRRRLPTTLQRTEDQTTCHRCSKAPLPLTLLRMSTLRRRHHLQQLRSTRPKSASDKITLHPRPLRWESLSGPRERWTLTKITTTRERTRRRARCPQADLGRDRLQEKARPVLQLALTDVLRMVLACPMARRKSSSLLKYIAPLSYDSDDGF